METASLTDAWRRKLWRRWFERHAAWESACRQRRQKTLDAATRGELSAPQLCQALLGPNSLGGAPPFPEVCRDLRCGAIAKSTGLPCLRRDLHRSSRCRLHGGLSSGPKSLEGKRRAAANGCMPKRKKHTS